MESRLRVGCSGWAYRDWVGPFYPPRTPASDFLRIYSAVFDTVEVDSSFYRVPSPGMVESWRRTTPDDFVFAAKLPRRVTHELKLRDVEEDLNQFYSSISLLGPKLGALVVQLPPSFRYEVGIEALEAFLPLLRDDMKHVVEFRHRSWFRDDVYALLERYNVSLAWAETRYLRTPAQLTGDVLYLRMVGDRELERFREIQRDRTDEMRRWLQRIRGAGNQVSTAFVFFNNHYAGFGPGSVNEFRRLAGLAAREFPKGGQKSLADF
jgi:uncharacterized protein YecE (DUF72 family)